MTRRQALLAPLPLLLKQQLRAASNPPYVIFSDDIGTDVDGAMGLNIALYMHRKRQINLIALLAGISHDYAPGYMKLFADFAGVSVPIGGYPNGDVSPVDNYCLSAMSGYQSPIKVRSDFSTNTTVARTALHNVPAGSTVIWVETGFAKTLVDFLGSPGDGIDSRTGAQIVADLNVTLYAAAGKFPNSSTAPGGYEWNIGAGQAVSPTWWNYVLANWAGPIKWTGIEVGDAMLIGAPWQTLPTSHPGRRTSDAWVLTTDSQGLRTRGAWGSVSLLLLRDPSLWTPTPGSIVIPYGSTPGIAASNGWSGSGSQLYYSPVNAASTYVTVMNAMLGSDLPNVIYGRSASGNAAILGGVIQ